MSYTSAQLVAAYTAANDGVAPSAATSALLSAFAAQTQTGQLSDSAALSFVINSADATTSVAEQTYQFFTGGTPSKAGLDFLVNSATNTTDLNDAYYAQFDQTNRYINFAGNLGVAGDGAAAFAATYGSLTFSDYVNVLYETIIGSSYAAAAGINVTAAKADIISRQANFVQIAKDRGLITATSTAAQQDIAVKAELVGYLMSEGVKADVGIYAAGANNFVQALINGNPVYATNLLTTYSSQGGGTGSAVGGTGATPGGTTSVFTTGIDALVGTAGNDTFVGDGSIAGQVTAADSANGGGGSDTFRYFSNTAVVPTLTSIENINLVSSATDIDLSGVAGLVFASIENDPTGNRQVTVAAGVKVGVTNVNNFTGNGWNETFVTGAQTSVSAVLNGDGDAGTLAINNAAISSISVESAGASANKIAGLTTTGGLKTINVTGAAGLNIVAAIANTVTTFDASANAGGVTAIMGTGGAADFTIKGGAGADSFNVAAITGKAIVTMGAGNDVLTLGALTPGATSTFDGGDGTDVISITKAITAGGGAVAIGNLSAANKGDFTNFETLRLATSTAPTALTDVATFDASNLPTGVTGYQIAASTAGIVLNNVAAAPSVTFTGSMAASGGFDSGLVVNLKDATGSSDVVNFTFAGSAVTGGRSVTSLSAPGVETLNIVSTNGVGSAQNTIGNLVPDASLTTVKISGSGAFNLTTGNLNHSATIDGSTATGSLTIDASATVTAGVGININGGTANDTIKAGLGAVNPAAPNQLIYGGAGGDVITLGMAHAPVDSLIYKAASDSVFDLVGTSGASAVLAANTGKMDVVNNFITGQDTVDLTAFALTNSQAVIADQGTAASAGAFSALLGSATFYQDASNTARSVAEVHFGLDTYLFVDTNHDGVFSATDLAIKFVGIGAVASNDLLH